MYWLFSCTMLTIEFLGSSLHAGAMTLPIYIAFFYFCLTYHWIPGVFLHIFLLHGYLDFEDADAITYMSFRSWFGALEDVGGS